MKELIIGCVLTSCAYTARFDDCAVSCADDRSCPSGLACGMEGLCRSPGQTQTCAVITGDAGVDGPPQFLSCVGLAPTCGPNGNEDCCSTARPIPGGTFYRGFDGASDVMYIDMSHPATVSAFVLDRFEVTVGRFRAFVNAGMGTQANPPMTGAGAHAKIPGSGWDASWNSSLVANTAAVNAAIQCNTQYQTWTQDPGANETLPINCITWFEAMAFCTWDNGYLPTEAEWNYAASGGGEQRAYPWSNPTNSLAINCTTANYNPHYPSSPYCTSAGGVNRVGSESPNGDGKWGQSDLGGNVDEWALDWYAQYSSTCIDCADLVPSGNRVVRSGDWINAPATLRTNYRNYTTPTGNRDEKVGFRCARPAP